MTEPHRAQLSFAERLLLTRKVTHLWEDWMRPSDQVLDDDQLLTTGYEALGKPSPKSRTGGGGARRLKSRSRRSTRSPNLPSLECTPQASR